MHVRKAPALQHTYQQSPIQCERAISVVRFARHETVGVPGVHVTLRTAGEKKNGGGLEEKGGTALVVIVYFFDSGVDCRNIRGIWGLRNLKRPLLQLGPHSRRRVS